MIYFIIKLGLVWGLIPALNKTGRPFLVAAIFAFGIAIFNFIFTASISSAIIVSVVYYAVACLYYWLLDWYSGRWIPTILIGILGIGVALFEHLVMLAIGLILVANS